MAINQFILDIFLHYIKVFLVPVQLFLQIFHYFPIFLVQTMLIIILVLYLHLHLSQKIYFQNFVINLNLLEFF